MENLEPFIKDLLSKIGWADYKLEIDHEHHHGSLFVHEDQNLVKDNLPTLVDSVNRLIQLAAQKTGLAPIFLDINNYRRERENLIVELARAAARKVVATKQEIPLPVMNSYERRLAHMELASRPDVSTESIGKGKGRYVVVRPIIEGSEPPPAVGLAED